jgi:hypothetical protein
MLDGSEKANVIKRNKTDNEKNDESVGWICFKNLWFNKNKILPYNNVRIFFRLRINCKHGKN